MFRLIQSAIREFGHDYKIDEILRLQTRISQITPEIHFGILFRRRWGRWNATISFHSDMGGEYMIEYDLDTAYWYVQGIADGMCGLSRIVAGQTIKLKFEEDEENHPYKPSVFWLKYRCLS